MKAYRLLFLGFGNVGRELAKLLLSRAAWLREHDLAFPVTGIYTPSRGLRADPAGLDLAAALEQAPATPGNGALPPDAAAAEALALAAGFPADIVIEMTPLRVDRKGEPAASHVRAALAAGRHVVTANKGPVAWSFRELDALARSAGRRFLFESTVMDGTPLFSLARHTLGGCRVLGCRGVLNSTTNFVLGRMAEGLTLEEAVRQAQAGGFAEADSSLDLEGWDAAVKLACIANVLMGLDLPPESIDRTGITGVTAADLAREAARGKVIKLVAEAGVLPGQAGVTGEARVGPVALPRDDILALVTGTSSAVTIVTDLMGPVTIFEEAPLVGQTAYGVFRDLLEIGGV